VPDPIGLCALADAEFHRAVYGALGINVVTAGGMWWAKRPASPVMMTGGTVAPTIDLTKVPDIREFRDSWGVLELQSPWHSEPDQPWMLRAAGHIEMPDVEGLTIDRAVDPAAVLAFERATVEIGGGLPGHYDGAIHPAESTAALSQLHLLIGNVAGEIVATALAAVTDVAVSIQAVSTRKDVRGRGIGGAMTAAAIAVAPDLPATLTASDLGYPVYRRLGFRDVGRGIVWRRSMG